MNLKFKISLILFSLLIISCNNSGEKSEKKSFLNDTITLAYIGTRIDEMAPSNIEKIEQPTISDYQGSYHFGESEGESSLEIILSNGKLFARTQYAEWEKDSWVLKSDRDSLKYVNNKVEIGKAAYELYKNLDDGEKGLVSHFFENINNKVHHYIQFNGHTDLAIPKGKYPETSFVKLTETEISSYSKYDLKIMRNEIFARNGYIFKKGDEMDLYFSQKKWYDSIKKISKPTLDHIEQHNMNLILKFEKQ